MILSCSSIPRNFRINVNIPENIRISKAEIISNIKTDRYRKDSNNILEVTVFYYSSGVEVMKYTEKTRFTYSTKNGSIKAILKFKKNRKIEEIIFISAKGKNKEEILKNFSLKMREVLR
ncbi:hypothetical protein ACFL20_09330 [Spirochaetota bacterium]